MPGMAEGMEDDAFLRGDSHKRVSTISAAGDENAIQAFLKGGGETEIVRINT